MRICYFLYIAFMLITFQTYAQPEPGNYGCRPRTNSGTAQKDNVYQQPYGTYNGKPEYNGTSWGVKYSNRPADEVQYPCAIWHKTTNNACYVRNNSGSHVAGDYGYFSGTLDLTCVPIDDYIIPLVFGVAGLAFYQFRKQQQPATDNPINQFRNTPLLFNIP